MSDDEDGCLVMGPFPVRLGDRGAPPRPDRALVFSLSDGAAELVTHRPSVLESRRYQYRYEVDTADKRLTWQDSLPSSVAGYFFRAELETAWRVSSAVEVVRRGITSTEKGDAVVRGGLAAMLVSRTQKFDIEDYAGAQQALNAEFGAGEHPLPEGITLSGFTARLNLDADAEQYVRTRHRMDWDAVLAGKQHVSDITAAQRKGEITAIAEDQLRAAAQREGGLLLYVVAQDPSQLRSVLQEVATHQDITLEQKRQLFRELIANKLVQPADVDVIWQTLFQQPQSFGVGPAFRALQQGSGRGPVGPPAPSAGPSTSPAPPPRPADLSAPHTDPVASTSAPDMSFAPLPQASTHSGPDNHSAASAQSAVGGVAGWKPVGHRHRLGTGAGANDAGSAQGGGASIGHGAHAKYGADIQDGADAARGASQGDVQHDADAQPGAGRAHHVDTKRDTDGA
jgi:hypothetical protein